MRTRALQFALEIESVNPAAGEASAASPPPVPADRVNHIFNTVITGGVVTFATGSDGLAQVVLNVAPGNLSSLVAHLQH